MNEAAKMHTLDQILAVLDNGNFLSQVLGEHRDLLAELRQHANDFGGLPKADFQIKISYKMDKNGAISVSGQSSFTPPKEPKSSATVWMTEDGSLTSQNPQQMRMDLRSVDQQREIKSV